MSSLVLRTADLDALSKVSSLGMEHAAAALSRMLGKAVSVGAPSQLIIDPAAGELPDAKEAICLHLPILGDLRGSIFILLREADAFGILELLLGRRRAAGLPLSELELSALQEVGNILASACLNALGTALGMTLFPSVPTLLCAGAGIVPAQVMEQPAQGPPLLLIDTSFAVAGALCDGRIFLVPAPPSLDPMLAALGAR